MVNMDAYLAKLVNSRIVDKVVAESRCYDPITFQRYLSGI